MLAYIARRVLQTIPILIGVSLVVFLLLRAKGDPVDLMLPPEATQADREAYSQAYGLDKPTYVQYGLFIWKAVQGDFGESLSFGRPAGGLVMSRLPASLKLAGSAVLLAVIVSIPLGILAAVWRDTIFDYLVMSIVVLAQSVASFWLAMLLILVFGVYLKLLPVAGSGTIQHLILPTLSLAPFLAALITRLVRSGMLEVLGQDYIRTARAKGLAERTILTRHALKNVLIPVITVVGMNIAWLIGGAIIIEVIFSWPGVGSLILDAINRRDYHLVMTGVMVVATGFAVVLLVVDIVYAYVDPRIRYS
ncbi:ABC transporter permease [Dehalococcoidia bacterium]|nr:ABC transporter permease [Dehalococcoidia bacterium]